MRIATLQFAPQLGRVSANIARADELLKEYSPGEIDLLVLPEMAFSGEWVNEKLNEWMDMYVMCRGVKGDSEKVDSGGCLICWFLRFSRCLWVGDCLDESWWENGGGGSLIYFICLVLVVWLCRYSISHLYFWLFFHFSFLVFFSFFFFVIVLFKKKKISPFPFLPFLSVS